LKLSLKLFKTKLHQDQEKVW